jgi:acyl-CoA thioesterase YciA
MSEKNHGHEGPAGHLILSTIAMPADTNPAGDIFGGWILSQMDQAGAVVARRRAMGRVVTIAIDAMKFHRPVIVGDKVSCYGTVVRVGRTSIAVMVETWVQRSLAEEYIKVTEGVFTFVAIDENRNPISIDRLAEESAGAN